MSGGLRLGVETHGVVREESSGVVEHEPPVLPALDDVRPFGEGALHGGGARRGHTPAANASAPTTCAPRAPRRPADLHWH